MQFRLSILSALCPQGECPPNQATWDSIVGALDGGLAFAAGFVDTWGTTAVAAADLCHDSQLGLEYKIRMSCILPAFASIGREDHEKESVRYGEFAETDDDAPNR